MDKKVKIYSTPTCPYCQRAKAYLDQKGIIYEEVDVSLDSGAAEEMVKLTNQMSVPVITIDGNIIIGFDKRKLEQLLKDA